MIDQVRIVRFKRFSDQTFDLSGRYVLLAGHNNSGKTTLLHALSAWHLALTLWISERGPSGGKKRISATLDEFTALPLREMNMLWLNRHTARRTPQQKQPKPAPIYIEVTVKKGELVHESLTIELMYANEKLLYIRPVKSPDEPDPIDVLPEFAKTFSAVMVPAFSGIGTQEPQHASGMQRKLVGEGKSGEILRNLLLDIWQRSRSSPNVPPDEGCSPWKELHADIKRLFQCQIWPPQFSEAKAYILSEYSPKANPSDPKGRPPRLDVANAGSGFHQVLLLLAFFYSRKAEVLLLDEPDAHLHFILQREVFDHLRMIAQRQGSQLIIGTHSEVLLEGTDPEQIMSFVASRPRRLSSPNEKQRLQDAMRQLNALDLLQADQVQAVLYVEDDTDYKLLREWAIVLNHAAGSFLGFPFVVPLKGKGNLDRAKKHFHCLRLANPTIRGLCILDRDEGDNDPSERSMPDGLGLRVWERYEIENYLIVPDVLKRHVRGDSPTPGLWEREIDQAFQENFPANLDYKKDIPALRDLKGSVFLVDLLGRSDKPLPKNELYILASLMKREEIHPDVIAKLNAIAEILPEEAPATQANTAPSDPEGSDEILE